MRMQFSKKVLSNGVRVVSIPMPESPTVTVMVLVEAGSKYETKEINGISHFLEHFVFKGTSKRPKASDLSRELDSLGAQYNAFTSQEFTGYYAKAHKSKTDKIFDIVADMYLNPTLPESELEKEKGVVIQEIHMYEDDPARHVQDLFLELLYGDQPAGWNVAGTPEKVASFNREQLIQYRNKFYVGCATTVIISGGFENSILEKAEEVFSTLNVVDKTEKIPVLESQSEPKLLIKQKETDQTHLVLGTRAFGVFDKRVPTLRVLSAILGAGMSSRLFVRLRDELGLCYYVGATSDLYTDHGIFQVSVGADTSKVFEAIEAVILELKKIINEEVPSDELRKTKDLLIGNMYLSLESSDELAQYYGSQEILRKPIKTPEIIAKEVESVTSEDVKKLAREIFVTENLNLALIGPFSDQKKFIEILKF
jgi:predicted Zn-dependent peptidase